MDRKPLLSKTKLRTLTDLSLPLSLSLSLSLSTHTHITTATTSVNSGATQIRPVLSPPLVSVECVWVGRVGVQVLGVCVCVCVFNYQVMEVKSGSLSHLSSF